MDWNKLLSTKRYHPGTTPSMFRSPDRSLFQRDYDRLIFSSPFRRLQNKTQVFPLPGNIFVHNRLTHSLEVASVGRSLGNKIAQYLRTQNILEHPEILEEIGTIVSTACLAHDLGNPPFGHSGEEAISYFFLEGEGRYLKKLLTNEEWADISHFEGNANTFRLLTHSFNGRRPGGYTMTYTTLASIVKYPFESIGSFKGNKYGFFQSEKHIYQEIAEELGIICLNKSPLRYARHPLVYLVEAADDICYQIMDIEDAHKLRILSHEETIKILMNFYDRDADEDKEDLKTISKTFKIVTDKNEQIAFLRAGIINKLINACASVFIQHHDQIMNGTFNGSLVQNLSGTLKTAYDNCSEVAYSRIYHTNIVTQIQIAGFKILATILKEYSDAILKPETYYARNILSVMPEQYKVNQEDSIYKKIQTVTDYVSGMTDSYALNLYRKIKGIDLPEISG